MCKEKKCDYLFSVDGSVVLTNKDTLKILIKQNRSVMTSIDIYTLNKSNCCAVSVASKQHYKQDLRKIYRRGDEFSN